MPNRGLPAAADPLLEEGLSRLRAEDPRLEKLLGPRAGEVSALLNRYIEEIELFNPAYGLVGVKDRRELVVKHILDSLAPLGLLLLRLGEEQSPPAADVGSGAGLPGIPLAIALPGGSFTLIERMGRRAGFLRDALAVLGLSNVKVEEGEMEKAAPGRFTLAVFRAFRPLEPGILRGLFRLLKPGGLLAAWKGRHETALAEITAAEQALPELRGRWEILPAPVPLLEEERHLLLIHAP